MIHYLSDECLSLQRKPSGACNYEQDKACMFSCNDRDMLLIGFSKALIHVDKKQQACSITAQYLKPSMLI